MLVTSHREWLLPLKAGWGMKYVEYIKCVKKAGSAVQKKACFRAAGCRGHAARKERCVWSREQISCVGVMSFVAMGLDHLLTVCQCAGSICVVLGAGSSALG